MSTSYTDYVCNIKFEYLYFINLKFIYENSLKYKNITQFWKYDKMVYGEIGCEKRRLVSYGLV
jgi:hypothetical protein